MLAWLKKTFNINIIFDYSRLKWYECLLIIDFIFVCLFISNCLPQWFINTIAPNGKEFDNIFNLFFSFNWFYIIYLFIYLKFEFISFIFSCLCTIFSDDFFFLNDNFYYLFFSFNKFGISNLGIFYNDNIYNFLFIFDNLSHLIFKKFNYIFYKFNLPLFFYFGLLFMLTTLISLFFLSYFGFYGVFIINLLTIFFFWVSSVLYFNEFFLNNLVFKINLGKWFVIFFSYTVFFELTIDVISYSFMFLTLTIAVFVYIYCFSYFRYEPNVERLVLLINCFVISMICLVISGNFFVLFLGWELIGLTSFFLINFWSTRISTLKSAFKAFVFNKFSDVSLLIAIILLFFCVNDSNILVFNSQIPIFNNYYLNIFNFQISIIEVISFFFSLCAFVKSAQFGFHVWLPDSMEAPVPASALIHSATLVSAGVFLLLKLSPVFELSLYIYYVLPIIGSFTAFIGGLSSVYQSDIKKILAYSTISHCGFLMVCYSTYITEYTILYLYIHGFFKASVFLCVGNVIRFSRNNQDFKKMGNFYKYLPFECFASFICLINLSGLPFSVGFYIKHLLLIGIYMNNITIYFIFINILFAAISGLIYSFRLFYYVFFDIKKSKKIIYNYSNNNNLNSFYYTNSTLASNISIIFLIFLSYFFSIYMVSIFLNQTSLGEGLDIYSVYSNQFEEFHNPLLSTINNISFFNWILLLVIIFICLFSWKNSILFYSTLNKLNIIIIFIIFFYIFYFFFI